MKLGSYVHIIKAMLCTNFVLPILISLDRRILNRGIHLFCVKNNLLVLNIIMLMKTSFLLSQGCHISSAEGRELLHMWRWPAGRFRTCHSKKSRLYFRSGNQLLCPFSKVIPATMLYLLWITR